MRIDASWDTVEQFGAIAEILFSESVLARSGIRARPIPVEQGTQVLTRIQTAIKCQGLAPSVSNEFIFQQAQPLFQDTPFRYLSLRGQLIDNLRQKRSQALGGLRP
jgi:hypothetical protein